MKKVFVLFVILLMLLNACAGNKKVKRPPRPDWMDNPESLYSPQTYLSAIGTGFDRSGAERDATAKLSRIFKTEVKATSTMEKRYEELTKANKTTTEEYAKYGNDVTLTSDESLINIKFGDSYTDDNAKVHVIGYLNRFETGTIYEEMIKSNSKSVIGYLNKAKSESDKMDKYAYCGAAWAIAQINEDLLRQFKIIQPQGSSMLDLKYEVTEIKHAMVAAAREITFTIKIEGDEDSRINGIISQILTTEGFQTIPEGGYININGSLNISKTDLKRDDDMIFFRWDLNLEMTLPDGSTILSLNPDGRVGHISEPEAISRVYSKAENELEKTLSKSLYSWFDNIVIKGE